MEVHTRKEHNAMVVSVKGRLDAISAPEFEKDLANLILKGENTFILSFSELEYISSAGLRSILATAKKLKEKEGQVVFAGLKGTVEEVIKISGFLSIFKTFDSEEAAIKEMK